MSSFYEVKFDNVEESNFFKYHEDAAAFLLEAYFDDNDVLEEEYIMDVNNQVADNDGIDHIAQTTRQGDENA